MRANVEVLVVDDSDNEAALTLDSLRIAAPGATALRLTDGEQALHFLCATDGFAGRPGGLPKLVLLDLHMPGIDGIGVVQALRARPEMQEMSVVLWTSNSSPLYIERGSASGSKCLPHQTIVARCLSRRDQPDRAALAAGRRDHNQRCRCEAQCLSRFRIDSRRRRTLALGVVTCGTG